MLSSKSYTHLADYCFSKMNQLEEESFFYFISPDEANYVDISSYEMDFADQGQSAKFPEAEDLEYPDIESAKGSVMGKVSASSDEQEMTFEKKQSLPSEDDLDYPGEELANDNSDADNSFKKISFDIDELKPVAKTEESSEKFPKGEDSEYPD